MAGANHVRLRVSHDWDPSRLADIGGAVPAFAFRVGIRVDFDDLGIVATVAKGRGDGRNVGLEAIRADLKALVRSSGPETFYESIRRRLAPASKGEVQNQLGMALQHPVHTFPFGIVQTSVQGFRALVVQQIYVGIPFA